MLRYSIDQIIGKSKSKVSQIGWAALHVIRNTAVSLAAPEAIRAYWWNPAVRNFGDLLTPALLKHYGYSAVHSKIGDSDLVCVGSILERVPGDYNGLIIGSGFMRKGPQRSLPFAAIVSLRGKLTRDRIGLKQDVLLADPGLLARKLLTDTNQVHRYVLGIVPHFKDRSDPRILSIKRRNRNDVKIINVLRSPANVIREIASCDYILSSSLHGLIVADALDIPNAWVWLSNQVSGEGFKFYDYYSSIGVSCAPLFIRGDESLTALALSAASPPPVVSEIIEKADKLFSNLPVLLANRAEADPHLRTTE